MAVDTAQRPERVRRDGAKLSLLIALTLVAFFATRAAAEHSRTVAMRDAAEWYARGRRAAAAHDGAAALDAFRRAQLKDRGNIDYSLALAQALAVDHQDSAAERLLLALRESAPERPDINLALARLAAARGDVAPAARYYRNALYAAWADPDGPRRVRLELIRFLLAHDDRQRATAELIAARAMPPDSAAAHLELATLFVRADDPSAALEEFRRTLDLDPGNDAARAGAGEAAFALGDYATARRFLRTVTTLTAPAREKAEIATLVLGRDPLEPRLGAAERRRRLAADLADVQQRAAACAPAAALEGVPKMPARLDQDAIEDALSAIWRIESAVIRECGPAAALDHALVVIAQRHGADR